MEHEDYQRIDIEDINPWTYFDDMISHDNVITKKFINLFANLKLIRVNTTETFTRFPQPRIVTRCLNVKGGILDSF